MSYPFSLIVWPCFTPLDWVGVISENRAASARYLRAWLSEQNGGWKPTDAWLQRMK
jgi:hypothetical protein